MVKAFDLNSMGSTRVGSNPTRSVNRMFGDEKVRNHNSKAISHIDSMLVNKHIVVLRLQWPSG